MSEECFVFKEIPKLKARKSHIKREISRKKFAPKNEYLLHLDRINNIASKIDHKAPPFMLSTFCPFPKLRSDNDRLDEIMKENITLLGRLNDIARSCSIYYERKDRNCNSDNVSRFLYRLQLIDEIEKYNFIFGQRLLNITGEIPTTKELNKSWKSMLHDIRLRCQHKLVLPELMERKSILCVERNRPMVYLDVGVTNSRPLGRLMIILYLDLAPKAVKNFIDLCENHRNWPNPNNIIDSSSEFNNNIISTDEDRCSCVIKVEEEPHHITTPENYEYISKDCQLLGTKFTRIFPNLFIYGGNLNADKKIQNFHGIPDYQPEKFKFHHGYKGTLSMCPMANGLINSEFTISLKSLRILDGKRLVFGRVIRGLGILDTISSYGTKNGKPQKHVEIIDCGILNLNLE